MPQSSSHNLKNEVFDKISVTATHNEDLLQRWQHVQAQIEHASSQVSRNKKDITLLAVSKTKPATMVADLAKAGQIDFGENYLQEAIDKMAKVDSLLNASLANIAEDSVTDMNKHKASIVWHYIGHIQRNKTREIAENFSWVHTIEREIIAKRLHEQRPEHLDKLNVLIQVNIDNEESKSGCLPEEVDALIDVIKNYSKLCLRGLMIIPSKSSTDAFERTKKLFDSMAKKHPELDSWNTLSMGMSADMKEAIKHGSTMVRVGSAIFGAR